MGIAYVFAYAEPSEGLTSCGRQSVMLKGTPCKEASGPEKQKMCKYFHLRALCGCPINIYAREVFFCLFVCFL